MMLEDILYEATRVTVAEGAALSGMSPRTVRRYWKDMRNQGLATYEVVGCDGHNEQRWLLTRAGVLQRYPNPALAPWYLRQECQLSLRHRTKEFRDIYRTLPNLFKGPGQAWLGGREAPSLIGVQLLRGNREATLFSVIGKYTHEISVAVAYVGLQVRQTELTERYEKRFNGMDTDTMDLRNQRENRWLLDMPGPDPDHMPRTSGILFLGDGHWAKAIASMSIPNEGRRGHPQPLMFAVADDEDPIIEGMVEPRPYEVVSDPPETGFGRLGRPQNVANPLVDPRPENVLGRALPNIIFRKAEVWLGISVQDIAEHTSVGKGKIEVEVEGLVAVGLLQRVGDMLYPGYEAGCNFIAARDRIHVTTVRAMVRNAISEDHKPVGGKRLHTQAVNKTMLVLDKDGLNPLPERFLNFVVTARVQVRPDIVFMSATGLGEGLYCLEVERTAIHPEQVQHKVDSYDDVIQAGKRVRVAFATETTAAEILFQRLGAHLPLLTTTLRDIRRGPLTGEETVWRRHGQSISLQPCFWGPQKRNRE